MALVAGKVKRVGGDREGWAAGKNLCILVNVPLGDSRQLRAWLRCILLR